jgi:hypothetical protein
VETNSLKTLLARILLVYAVLTGLTIQARLGRVRMTCERRPFCIRMSTRISNFTKEVMADKRMDFITEWVPSKSGRVTAKSSNPVRVRVTKAVLETGEAELLVSSLQDMELFKTEDLVELYGMRWGVEEGLKNLKPKIKVEQFGCRKPQGIYQEFYAHILEVKMKG